MALWLGCALVVASAHAAVATVRTPHPVLPWIANDYPRALALAQARKVPIFVEAWAPW